MSNIHDSNTKSSKTKDFPVNMPEAISLTGSMEMTSTVNIRVYRFSEFEPKRRELLELARRVIPELNVEDSIKWVDLVRTINELRPDWQVDAVQYVSEFEAILNRHLPKQKRSDARALAINGCIKVRSDRISRALVDAYQPGGLSLIDDDQDIMKKLNAALLNQRKVRDDEFSLVPFWAGREVVQPSAQAGNLEGWIGLRGKMSNDTWEALQRHSALAVKLQVLLMARIMAETGGEPGEQVVLNLNQVCDDLGYTRKKGAHTTQSKQLVKSLLDIITRAEVAIIFSEPGKPGDKRDKSQKYHKLEGPYFQRHMSHDTSSDLFNWTPETIVVSAGDFFACEEFREYNRNVASVAEGLLRIDSRDQNKHALLLGAYLCFFAKINKAEPKTFRVRTLIEKIFDPAEIQKANEQRHVGRLLDTVERALNQLMAAGVIGGHRNATAAEIKKSGIDYDNLDSRETRQAMHDESKRKKKIAQEMNKSITITWPKPVREALGKGDGDRAELPPATAA